ncbi:hypothetical protein C2G38_2157963 [Gigaspora rosea]|uniref:BTB domain-containing protein n=1 Tax=Gigaspora rosea TaxID=44941 RepID=A0A397W2Y4_9GLOM|nr:hypothetical protein C2G38_2157963 [Gigaspora rosea]
MTKPFRQASLASTKPHKFNNPGVILITIFDNSQPKAHSAILKYRSLYFRNELTNINRDKNNIKTVNLNDVTIQQFEIIIKYIYGGIVSLEDLDTLFVFDLMVITCEFLFEELAKRLETYLIETKASWLRLHFSKVFQKSFQNNKFQELQNWCNDIIVKHPEKFFESENFTSIQENASISLIKRDDLQMEEVKIWKHIIKWGIAQNPGLSSDPKNWSNDNFLTIKTTLQNCLPFIRFFQISSEDVNDYLQPYRRMLDENLWDDIFKKCLSPNRPISTVILPPRVVLTQTLPPRTTEPFSKIINEAQAAEITSWIDKKADTDGFTPASFWNLCDRQTNLIVVVKVKDTDEILGGRVKNPEYAIYCSSNCGPVFGGRNCDLVIYNSINECWNVQSAYEKRIRNVAYYSGGFSYFSVDEYEIFQLNKKS